MEAVGAVFGIADVALRTSSKLWTLSGAWRDAPGDLERLMDDLARTQRFFSETQEGINAMYGLGSEIQKESHSSLREMERLIDEGYVVLMQIEHFIDNLTRPSESLDEPRELGKRRRIIWMTSAGKVSKLRAELRSITSNVCRLLIAQNVSTSAGIYMSLEKSQDDLASYVSDRITSHTEQSLKSYQNFTLSHLGKALEMSQSTIILHMNRRLEDLEARVTSGTIKGRKPGASNISLNLQQIQLQVSLGKKSIESQDHEIYPYRSEKSDFASWKPPTQSIGHRKRGQLCNNNTCRCQCHSASSYDWAMVSMKAILGSLGMTYRGYPTRCTSRGCRYFGQNRRAARRIHVMYSFPRWLARASMYILYSSNLNGGSPELVIRIVNRLPKTHLQANSIFGRVRAGDVEGVKSLLREGLVGVNDIIADIGVSLLFFAIVFGSPEMVRVLLAAGADPFQEAAVGIGSAVAYAFQLMMNGEPEKIKIARLFPIDRFIEDMEFPPLSRIVMGDLHVDLEEALQSTEYSSYVNHVSPIGWAPLDIAVHKGDVEAMRLLIRAGADVNAATGTRASTPLLRACINGNYEATKLLLEAGASIHVRDVHRMGPMSNAAKSQVGTGRLISLLTRYGVDIETRGGMENTVPLVYAVIEGTMEVTAHFLNHGADPDRRDQDGDTCIVDAIMRGHCDKMELLVDHGCDLGNINNEGKGILHCLASYGTVEMMKVFTERKITKLKPGLKDKLGNTPMHCFNERDPPPTTEYREAFDRMLDNLERGYYGLEDDSDGDELEFFDALDTLS